MMVQPRVRWMVTFLLLALVGRVGAALMLPAGFHFPDEAVYFDATHRLSSGDGFGPGYNNVPAYPAFLLILSFGQSASLGFLRIAQAVVAAFGTLAIFALADRIFGRRVAIVAGLIFALDPLVVISSALLYPETVASLIVPLVVLTAMEGVDRDALIQSALSGALLGLLALLRPVALVLPPVVAGWALLTLSARPARRLAHVGVIGLAFLLVLAPWTIRNLRVRGGLVPVATMGSQAAPVRGDEVARRGLATSMAETAWTDPGAFVSRLARQFVQFWELTPTRLVTDDPIKREELHRHDERLSVRPLVSTRLRDEVSAATFGLELTLAIVGLMVGLRFRPRRTLLLAAIILIYAVGFALFVAKLRYRISVLPLVFIFAAVGAVAVGSIARRKLNGFEPAMSPAQGG